MCRHVLLTVPALTVWSLWRNNTVPFYLPTHVRFYLNFWKAERLFLNIGYIDVSELKAPTEVLNALCGTPSSSETIYGLTDAFLEERRCPEGQKVLLLSYKTSMQPAKVFNSFKRYLFKLYRKYDATPLRMYVDHDEFFVPAYRDVAGIREKKSFNYHMVDIKPVSGKKNWTEPFEWVDQPYFYKVRATHSGPSTPQRQYKWDGNEAMTTLWRRSHCGPHPEHAILQKLASKGDAKAFASCARAQHIMYHVTMPSKQYFLEQKHWDQTTPKAAFKPVDPLRFRFLENPEREFLVFRDEFLRPFVSTF